LKFELAGDQVDDGLEVGCRAVAAGLGLGGLDEAVEALGLRSRLVLELGALHEAREAMIRDL
jgi:hypothetical protein